MVHELREEGMQTGMTNRNGEKMTATHRAKIIALIIATIAEMSGMLTGMIATVARVITTALHTGQLHMVIITNHAMYIIAIIMCIMTVTAVSISHSLVGIISTAIQCHHI
jgi:hypothetical protein